MARCTLLLRLNIISYWIVKEKPTWPIQNDIKQVDSQSAPARHHFSLYSEYFIQTLIFGIIKYGLIVPKDRFFKFLIFLYYSLWVSCTPVAVNLYFSNPNFFFLLLIISGYFFLMSMYIVWYLNELFLSQKNVWY